MSDFADIQNQFALEEAKRKRFLSDEKCRQWADELQRQMVHSEEYQRKCTPEARRVEEALLNRIVEEYFKRGSQ
jgi:hypothetical protein